jgi:HK97 family phage prohead protease
MPYSDYPKAASEQAQRALNHREENGSDCGTLVGWERANQLASRETISEEIVKRTYSFLSRSKVYDQGDFTDADGKEICGSVMYAAWGGDPMLRWCEKIVANLEESERAMNKENNTSTDVTGIESRHIQSIAEDESTMTIVFRKPMDEERKDKEKYRAEPGELSVGDFVSWRSSGGRSQGRITEIETDGSVMADSGFEVNGTEDDPAALISVYELDEDEGLFVERDPMLVVAHRFSALEKMNASEFRSTEKTKTVEYRFKPADKVTGTANVERRTYEMELRMDDKSGKPQISGYAAVYDSESELFYGNFREKIARGAFDNADMSDVRALFNHDPNFVLGRTKNNTLTLELDERGLRYTITPPDTQLVRDLVIEPMKRGDVSQSSFGFTLMDDEWDESGEYPIRTLTRIGEVMDVSPVTFPAYTETEASARSIERRTANKEKEEKRGKGLAEYKLRIAELPEGK